MVAKKEEWKEMFTMIDESGTGKIPSTKLGLCMRALQAYPTEEEVASYIKESDPKGAGTVDFAALCKHMEKQKPLNFDAAVEAFRVFDKDENGTVSAMELKHVLVSMGEKLTADEAEDFMKDADIDKEGNLKYVDLLKMCCGKD
jgi:calmodulin